MVACLLETGLCYLTACLEIQSSCLKLLRESWDCRHLHHAHQWRCFNNHYLLNNLTLPMWSSKGPRPGLDFKTTSAISRQPQCLVSTVVPWGLLCLQAPLECCRPLPTSSPSVFDLSCKSYVNIHSKFEVASILNPLFSEQRETRSWE